MPPLRLLQAVVLAVSAAGCCVAPPRADEWLAIGWRSPEAAFATFQTAIRADEPELEYRCFSQAFRERNDLSKIVWREAREELRRAHPWLRRGIADATFSEGPFVIEGRASGIVVSHGQRIRIDFVREDFAELWAGDRPVSDELVRFTEHTSTQKARDGRTWFQGSIVLPAIDTDPATITEMRLGREWKIDGFESLATENTQTAEGAGSHRAQEKSRHPLD
ncbi:MAG: hypothetical protein JNL28_08410 [Planctomycetes bacterium]|nr:hypothetical protein [Planctomycetota bacterium]